MHDNESEAEPDEDFGKSLRAPELSQLLARARAAGDREVRLLVKQHQALRRATADLLADLEQRGVVPPEGPTDTGAPVSYPVGFLRFLLRDDPRTPRIS
jgi:hypothetical protein